jgi:hypothetical protein
VAFTGGGGTGATATAKVFTKVAEVTLPMDAAKIATINAACQRGDIVVYYTSAGDLAHSQTVWSESTTYGANNEPLTATNGGVPWKDEAWKWAESAAGRWADNGNASFQPFVVKVYRRP